MTRPALTKDHLLAIYAETKTIAVVGASQNERKASYEIPRYLHSQGYRIIPVSPKEGELFGEPIRASLADIDEPIDVVDVFRPPEEAQAVAQAAIDAGANVLWFQIDTESPEAVELASAAGLTVVTGYCMGALHGRLGLGPGPGPHD
jgi:predicted CoA-binding protein